MVTDLAYLRESLSLEFFSVREEISVFKSCTYWRSEGNQKFRNGKEMTAEVPVRFCLGGKESRSGKPEILPCKTLTMKIRGTFKKSLG